MVPDDNVPSIMGEPDVPRVPSNPAVPSAVAKDPTLDTSTGGGEGTREEGNRNRGAGAKNGGKGETGRSTEDRGDRS